MPNAQTGSGSKRCERLGRDTSCELPRHGRDADLEVQVSDEAAQGHWNLEFFSEWELAYYDAQRLSKFGELQSRQQN
eukprot:3489261-Amphidinium_carterae.1